MAASPWHRRCLLRKCKLRLRYIEHFTLIRANRSCPNLANFPLLLTKNAVPIQHQGLPHFTVWAQGKDRQGVGDGDPEKIQLDLDLLFPLSL